MAQVSDFSISTLIIETSYNSGILPCLLDLNSTARTKINSRSSILMRINTNEVLQDFLLSKSQPTTLKGYVHPNNELLFFGAFWSVQPDEVG